MIISRQQFESRYPVPKGVEWNPESSRYALVEIKTARNTGSTIASYEAYVHSWGVWKSAWEAAESTMHRFKPAGEPRIGYTGCVICGQYTDHQGLPCPKRMALASADLRVSP